MLNSDIRENYILPSGFLGRGKKVVQKQKRTSIGKRQSFNRSGVSENS